MRTILLVILLCACSVQSEARDKIVVDLKDGSEKIVPLAPTEETQADADAARFLQEKADKEAADLLKEQKKQALKDKLKLTQAELDLIFGR